MLGLWLGVISFSAVSFWEIAQIQLILHAHNSSNSFFSLSSPFTGIQVSMTHLYSLSRYVWLVTIVVIVIFLHIQAGWSQQPKDNPCVRTRKDFLFSHRSRPECIAKIKLPFCSGVILSRNDIVYKGGLPDEEIEAACCSASKYKVEPRRLNYTCPDKSEIHERHFVSIAIECGLIDSMDLGTSWELRN